MYCTEKPFRDENYKPRKIHRNTPSFSSTLLDEIYRSIDENAGKIGDSETCGVKPARFTRACLAEQNWMEKEKVVARRKPSSLFPELENNNSFQDNDLLFYNSNLSSSSDDYYQNHHRKNKMEDDLIKLKSRAFKVYAKLKKIKQPISPGGRLTSFINSLFTNFSHGKKSQKQDSNKGSFQEFKRSSSSTCSSAPSFRTSCLSKYSTESRDKIMRDGVKRTVRFHPVGMIVGEDSKPCGRPPLPPNALREKNRKVDEEVAKNVLKSYQCDRNYDFSMFRKIRNEKDEDEEEEDDDDAGSDSSSDLFELDHLAMFGNNRFCEELPVYETTCFEKNRAIGSGLIC